jgi:hypothetical protein
MSSAVDLYRLLTAACKRGNEHALAKTLGVFKAMEAAGVQPDGYAYNPLLGVLW